MLQKRELSQTTKDLLAAADYIRKRGWCQGNYVNPVTGGVCIIGALTRTAVWPRSAAKAIFDRIGVDAAAWNDDPVRTKDEVIELLEEVAWEQADVAAS